MIERLWNFKKGQFTFDNIVFGDTQLDQPAQDLCLFEKREGPERQVLLQAQSERLKVTLTLKDETRDGGQGKTLTRQNSLPSWHDEDISFSMRNDRRVDQADLIDRTDERKEVEIIGDAEPLVLDIYYVQLDIL